MRRLDHERGDLGDFQTPRDLVDAVLQTLGPIGARWTRILEPTCGSGSFLQALLEHEAPPRELIGIEIQESYWTTARSLAGRHPGSRVDILRANLFDLDLRTGLPWRDRGPLLVVGNPPWITSAALGKLDSGNVPSKRNLKGVAGHRGPHRQLQLRHCRGGLDQAARGAGRRAADDRALVQDHSGACCSRVRQSPGVANRGSLDPRDRRRALVRRRGGRLLAAGDPGWAS